LKSIRPLSSDFCFGHFRLYTQHVRTILWAAAISALPALCFGAPPRDLLRARDLIAGLPFTPEQVEKIAGGGIAMTPVVPVSEGELAIALGCLVKRDQ
jgi:hypothetical protein